MILKELSKKIYHFLKRQNQLSDKTKSCRSKEKNKHESFFKGLSEESIFVGQLSNKILAETKLKDKNPFCFFQKKSGAVYKSEELGSDFYDLLFFEQSKNEKLPTKCQGLIKEKIKQCF